MDVRPAVELTRADARERGPLKRKPKALELPPAVFQRGSSGIVMRSGTDADDPDPSLADLGTPAPGSTDDTATTRSLAELLTEDVDHAVLRAARQIAARLSLRRPVVDRATRRPSPRTSADRYRGDDAPIDLDASIESIIERGRDRVTLRDVEDDDVMVRSPRNARRAVALIVDVSGSMKGEKASVVGAAVGALAAELHRDEVIVVAFWKDCAILHTPRTGRRLDPAALLEDLLRLPRKGLTNVHVGLEIASRELARSRATERCALLLSDCVHNAGPDPRDALRLLPRLHVLLETDGEHDAWLARELASIGGGRLGKVRTHRDVAPQLNRLLAT